MRLLIAFLYHFGSLILLLDSVINIPSFYNVEASGAGFTKLSSIFIIGAIIVGTIAVRSTITIIFGVFVVFLYTFLVFSLA